MWAGGGGLLILLKQFYFFQKFRTFSLLGFGRGGGVGGRGGVGIFEEAVFMPGFLLEVARPMCLRRVKFPSIVTNSCWFNFGCGFLVLFFLKFL